MKYMVIDLCNETVCQGDTPEEAITEYEDQHNLSFKEEQSDTTYLCELPLPMEVEYKMILKPRITGKTLGEKNASRK